MYGRAVILDSVAGLASATGQLFDVFVPLDALADGRPQSPARRLRGVVDRLTQLLQPLGDDTAVAGVELRVDQEMFADDRQVAGDGAPQPPIARGQPGDNPEIHRFVVAWAKRVLAQQHDRVDQVLLVDPGD